MAKAHQFGKSIDVSALFIFNTKVRPKVEYFRQCR